VKNVLALVLGGGAGTRLFPLTAQRSKPAVPFGAKYRIVDVPLSNCINSGINRIFILTQFNSASLNQHVTNAYRFSIFSKGFVNILAAEQTPEGQEWFRGTADAVRKVLSHVESYSFRQCLILSGDQLYQMDLERFLQHHVASGAAISVATTPVTARDASGFGIMHTNEAGHIVKFVEKPPPERLAGLESDVGPAREAEGRRYLASMGIYVFERETLFSLLREQPQLVDFGRDVIPYALGKLPVVSFPHDGYWTDIGTVDSFFEANLALTDPLPQMDLYDADRPIYTHARQLPPSKTRDCHVNGSILGMGCVLESCTVARSVIGVRALVGSGARLSECVVLGADFYESLEDRARNVELGRPHVGIGEGARLERCIVDKNARIGRGAVLRGWPGRPDADGDGWHVRDGIVVVPKNATIPDGAEV